MERLTQCSALWLSVASVMVVAVPVGEAADDSERADSGPLTVEQTLWGLGHVAPRVFNQVAVQIRNDSPDVFDGTLWLEPQQGGFSQDQPTTSIGRELYLTSGETRWVQFGAYLADGATEWRVRWGPFETQNGGAAALAPPATGSNNVVALKSSTRSMRMPSFPSERFPTKSTLLDGLFALVIAEPPNWQPGQERAFAEWLARGGRVIVDDEIQWSGVLGMLNKPVPEIYYGAGIVVRSGAELDELTEQAVREAFSNAKSAVVAMPATNPQLSTFGGYAGGRYAWDLDGEVFLSLDTAATPSSLVFTFYVLLAIYLILIATLSLRTLREGWKSKQYFARLAVLVVVASAAFAWASPLSSSMGTEHLSMTFATDLQSAASPRSSDESGKVDLRHFAVYRMPVSDTVKLGGGSVSGGSYDNSDAGGRLVDSELVSIGSSQVSPVTIDGLRQETTVDVPGLTNVFIRSRLIVDAEPARWRLQGEGSGTRLFPDNELAEELEPVAALVQRGAFVWRFRDSGTLNRQPKALRSFLVNPSMNEYWDEVSYPVRYRDHSRSEFDHILDAAGKAVPAFHRVTGTIDPSGAALRPDVARLFVLTETPKSFRVHEPPLPHGVAYTVWCSQIEDRNEE